MTELICQNSNTGEVFEISSLASNIQHFTDLNGNPGQLTFTLQQDPNGILQISSGSLIRFIKNNNKIFFGNVFTSATDATGVYKITAYDQMRYLKNNDSLIMSGLSASRFFESICSHNNLRYKVDTPTAWIVPDYLFNNNTLYSMLEHAIQKTNVATGKCYFIRDEFGTLIFSELGRHKTNLVIGDKSLLIDYQYEVSIDKDTFKTVKLLWKNDETGKLETWIAQDSFNQKRWGKLQLLQTADKEKNDAQIRLLSSSLLKLKNRETRTMKLTALGVHGFSAGTGFTLRIGRLGIEQDMWIQSATHSYEKDHHIMNLDVCI